MGIKKLNHRFKDFGGGPSGTVDNALDSHPGGQSSIPDSTTSEDTKNACGTQIKRHTNIGPNLNIGL